MGIDSVDLVEDKIFHFKALSISFQQYVCSFSRSPALQDALSFGPPGHYATYKLLNLFVSEDTGVFHADECLGTKMDGIQTLKISRAEIHYSRFFNPFKFAWECPFS